MREPRVNKPKYTEEEIEKGYRDIIAKDVLLELVKRPTLSVSDVAHTAYFIADQMIIERKKRNNVST